MEFVVYERLPELSLNRGAGQRYREVLERCVRAEQLGYDAVHLAAGSAEQQGLVFAAVLAARTGQVPIRLLLDTPRGLIEGAAMLASLLGERLDLVQPGDAPGLNYRVYLADSDDDALDLAPWDPVANRVVSLPERVATELERLSGIGGDRTVVLDFSFLRVSAEQQLASMERFSRDVMPRFRPQPMMPSTFA